MGNAAKAERTSGAIINGQYRYLLWRRWGMGDMALWVMLNPSTADDTQDDPTIRRCIGFTKAWGYDGLYVCNLFALRSTNPQALYDHDDPVGTTLNDRYIKHTAARSAIVIGAWGAHGTLFDRGPWVSTILARVTPSSSHNPSDLWCLGRTKYGQPKHPLYLPKTTQLERFK